MAKPFYWSRYWISECLCKQRHCNSKSKPVYFVVDTIKKQNTAWIWPTNCSIKIFKHFYGERRSWFWLWLQYSYEARFTMSTYLCIQCAQSFTLEHYFAGSYSKDTLIEMRQRAFFTRFIGRINYFWTFLWRTSNYILRPIKPSILKLKKSRNFHAWVSR